MKVSKSFSKWFNGYSGPRSTNISPGESVDVKETVSGEIDIDIRFADG